MINMNIFVQIIFTYSIQIYFVCQIVRKYDYNKIIYQTKQSYILTIQQNIIQRVTQTHNNNMKARSSSSKNNLINIKSKNKSIYNTNLAGNNLTMSISMNLQDKAKQKNNNFIEANKQNLYNFFKDRIPKEKIRLEAKHNIMSPTKIFQLRKQQIQKQKETAKLLMEDSCEIEPLYQIPSTKKMNKSFHANSKTKELNNSMNNTSKWIKLGGSTSSYQTPTQSSLSKRSQITKKKAYISVFGEKNLQFKSRLRQIQSIGSLTIIENENNKSKQKIRPRTNLKYRTEQQRAKLNSLILKIQNFSKQINPHHYIPQQSPKIFQKQHEFEYKKQLQKGQLIEWIKQISKNYKKKNQQINIHRMKTVEDIQKIDPDFYFKMKNHKNSRLLVRNRALDNIKFKDQKKYNSFIINKSSRDIGSQQDGWMDNLITITDRNRNSIQYVQSFRSNQQIVYNKLQVLSSKQKLKSFGKNLIQSTNKAKLFSVKLYNVFLVFWKKRKPYQLQGSYGFFKYIKAGDLQKVQNFVIKNLQYAFQIDAKQRTPLIYAVQNGYIGIVKFLISIGLNIDAKNIYGYTALYYALLKNNYQIVQCLLKAGASPWSNQFYKIGKFIQSCSQQIKIIIKNARKIHIARHLIRRITGKQAFWAANKDKIQGKYVIAFS